MISSQHRVLSARDNLSRREVTPIHCYRKQPQLQVNAVPASPRRKSGHVTRHNSQKRVSPGVESPVLDQVRERIYSEVASLVRQNETRPYYMLELIRVAQLLNSDYLRKSGLSCLKRVINDDENCDLIDAEAFSAIPQPPPAPFSFIPCTQVARRQESVYSPSQNVLLRHYYLDSNLSGSSEKVDERSVSQSLSGVCDEDESDISEKLEESLKECEENLDQFKEYKVKEFQEVLPNTSDEIEALSNSLSLLRIEYTDEKESRTKQDIQLSSVREDKELSRQRYQQLVLLVEGYPKEIEELKTAGRERDVLKDNRELTNTAGDSVDDHLQEANNLKAELRDKLCNQKQELEDVLLENAKLTNDVEYYTKQLSEPITKLEQMVSINTELSETISKLRKEVADAELAVNSRQTDLTTSRDQVEQEKYTVNELEILLSEANKRETELQVQIPRKGNISTMEQDLVPEQHTAPEASPIDIDPEYEAMDIGTGNEVMDW
ncbi:Pericentriolar material 1 protein isoform X2 [Oopsacas minuta]|uniref:Pericentriolar material 1 protein isoform X2 n=1 Tax=Oopsacas minuta TaxID=111878 RepID=A0AAV7KG37_9METZ|nr:Pericentriolar material 1 protein isoform X2 [Oopsacas minuta]